MNFVSYWGCGTIASLFEFVHLLRIPNSLVPPFWFLVLLIRDTANMIDITAINAAVRKVRSYDSGDGNEVEILFVSDSIVTWFACINVPAITGPTDAPTRYISRFIPNDTPLNCFGVDVSTTFTEPICIKANPIATKINTVAIEASVE
jgi:hypothetical protein